MRGGGLPPPAPAGDEDDEGGVPYGLVRLLARGLLAVLLTGTQGET